MRLCRLVFLMAAFYTSTLLNAQTVGSTFNSTDGKMTYTVTAIGSTNTVSVGKLGNPVGSITIPDTVNYNSKTFLVTEIQHSAFTGCKRIDTVTIGKNISKIGHESFYGCDSITEINYNATNCEDLWLDFVNNETAYTYAFLFKSNELCTVNIGSDVQKIPDNIFYKQSSIKAVNFLGVSSCKEIGARAFAQCNNMAFSQLILPDSLQLIDAFAFAQCFNIKTLTIGKSITQVGELAFGRLYKLDTVFFNATNCDFFYPETFKESADSTFVVIVGNNVKRIPRNLFYNYDAGSTLRSVLFENGSTCSEIGKNAFVGATKMLDVTLPDSLLTIKENAFANCTGLETISISKSVTDIATGAFSGSTGIFDVNADNPSYSASDGILYNKDKSILLACSISQSGVFAIPESVKSIAAFAFSKCTKLTSITIPYGVTTIGEAAFYNCKGLHTIILPHLIDSIGDMAFQGCENLTFFITQQSTPPRLGGFNVFNGKPSRAMLFVPSGSKSLYDASFGAYFNPSKAIVEGKQFYSDDVFEYMITDTILKTASVFRLSPAYTDSTLVIPSSIQYNAESYSVTAIGNDAFNGFTILTSIIIPNSVTGIGNYAFFGCSSLTSITLPETVEKIGANAYQNCTNLQSVTFSNSLRTIENYAFQNCTKLQSIELPNSVVSIGIAAFKNCTTLESCYIGNSINTISDNTFQNCTALTSCILGNSVEAIGDYAFQNCSAMKTIIIPDSTQTIGEFAFNNCTSLDSCTIGERVKVIGNFAFQNCTALRSLTIPDSTQNIGSYAFTNCTSLDSCIIGKSVTSIGNNAFQNCTTLRSIVIPDAMTTLNNSVFQNCTALQYCTIGKAITTIKDSAFQACSALKTLSLPESVKTVGQYAFSSCSSLDSLDLGTKLSRIVYNAFSYCTQLTTVTIPESVTTISEAAFSDCSKLKKVNFNAIQCGSMGTTGAPFYVTPFSNCAALTTIHLGDKVTMLPNCAFSSAAALTTVTGGPTLKRVGDRAFFGCSKLRSFDLPDSVTFIGQNAFSYCNELTSITFGKHLDSIGHSAFSYCVKLRSVRIESINCRYMGTNYSSPVFNKTNINSVTVGDSVTHLAHIAFYNCSYLTSITMESSTPPSLGNDAFFRISSTAKLYVPNGSKANYVNNNMTNTYTSYFSTGGTTDGARIIELAPTAINNPADAGVSITGTSDGLIVIQGSKELSGAVSVYNMAGQLQTTCSLNGARTVMPDMLRPGVYLAVIQSNGRRKTVKIRID